LMQWSPTNGLREVVVHVDVVVLEVVVHVDVVVLEASRRVRVRSPKTLSAAYPEQLGMSESSNTEGEERGLLNSSTWV
jgi:hypothetical protein